MEIKLVIIYKEDMNGDGVLRLMQEVDPPMCISQAAILGILERAKYAVYQEKL